MTSDQSINTQHQYIYYRGSRHRDHMVLDLQLPVQSVPFTTKVVSSNPVHCKL
jgi:hypothetical protein